MTLHVNNKSIFPYLMFCKETGYFGDKYCLSAQKDTHIVHTKSNAFPALAFCGIIIIIFFHQQINFKVVNVCVAGAPRISFSTTSSARDQRGIPRGFKKLPPPSPSIHKYEFIKKSKRFRQNKSQASSNGGNVIIRVVTWFRWFSCE